MEAATGPPRLQRIEAGPTRDVLLPLLALADDSMIQVRSYYQQGDLYVLCGDNGAPNGTTLVLPVAERIVQLKSVAVVPALQGRGLGQQMLRLVLEQLEAEGVRRVLVGTASCSVGQLAFYQKLGFRLSTIERDYFSVERGYPEGIEENGIPLRDMVWMDRVLPHG
jgi:ribosomal protein S18 acetylase RimI-like enzyme